MKNIVSKWLFSGPPKQVLKIEGTCLKCGSCCEHINICEEGKWVKQKSHFKQIVVEKPSYARFQITGKNDKGTLNFKCSWLNPDNTCKDYKNRMDLCKTFPDKMAIMGDGILPETCGYTFSVHHSFDAVLKKTVRRRKFRDQWQAIRNFFNIKNWFSRVDE